MRIRLLKEYLYSEDGINAKKLPAGEEIVLPDTQAVKWIQAGVAEQVHDKQKAVVEQKEEKQEATTKEEKAKPATKEQK